MTMDLEERLIESMRHETAGLTLTPDVLGRATRRHRRRALAVRTAYGLGVVGLAALLAVGLTTGRAPAPRPAPPVAAASQSPEMRLAAAVQRSDGVSYRFRVTSGDKVYEGAFDPRTDTGYLRHRQDGTVRSELLLSGVRYTAAGDGPYVRQRGRHPVLSLFQPTSSDLGPASPRDPELLFRPGSDRVRESAGGLLRVQGSRIIFGGPTTDFTRDITIGADARIARVTETFTWRPEGRTTRTTVVTTELSGYGDPVRVEVPRN